MQTKERNSNKGKIEGIDKLVDQVVAYMRDARPSDALSHVKEFTSQAQSLRVKTDHDKIVRVDTAVEQLCSRVGHMKPEPPAATATLNRVVSLLRRFRNAFVNINAFPEELLRAIFVWFSGADIMEKMRIATTCSRWREVCLAFLDFWADFTASYNDCALINKALPKAKGRPLTFAVSRFDNHLGAVAVALCEHNTAIRSLSLCLCSHSSVSLASVLLPQLSLPWLRELRLTYQPPGGLARMVEAEVLPDIPNAGQFETVVLTNCRWSYKPSAYPGIKSLSLLCDTDQEPHYFPHDDLGRLCDALAGSPDLVELMLSHPFMHAEEVLENRAMPPILLLRLRSLRVHMAVEKASALLSRLQTSPHELQTVVLILTSWKTCLEAYIPEPDSRTLLAIPHPVSLPMLRRLGSLALSHGHNIVGGFAETLPAPSDWDALRPGAEIPLPLPGLYVQFNMSDACWSLRNRAFDNLLMSIVEHYVLDRLQTLRLEHFDWGVEQVMSVLRVTPLIHTLTFGTHTQPDRVLKAIADRREECVEPFLPELRVVRLVHADLNVYSNVLPELHAAVKRLGLRSLSFEECRSWLDASELAEQLRGECPGLDAFRCVDLIKVPKCY